MNAAAFWMHVDRTGGPDACWPWTGSRDRAGYGRVSWQCKHTGTHRLAYQLTTGMPIAPGMVIRHTCDNPPCCNPAHLLEGTQRDNIRDSIERHRFCFNKAYGERNGHAKLSSQQVHNIINWYHKGLITQSEAARLYGVSRFVVNQIVHGSRWGHLTRPEAA